MKEFAIGDRVKTSAQGRRVGIKHYYRKGGKLVETDRGVVMRLNRWTGAPKVTWDGQSKKTVEQVHTEFVTKE